MDSEKRFAILIDADNISADYIKFILDEISNKGVATYKRIYGDWTKPNLGKWKDILLDYSITPMQQYGYTTGKNSTDSAMIIDAMDILYSGKVDGFCLATSDSDFTKLASRLREAGMTVIGMGEAKTPRPFISACDEFKFIDKLASSARAAEPLKKAQEQPAAKKAVPAPKTTEAAKPTVNGKKPVDEPAHNGKKPVEETAATDKKQAEETSQTNLAQIKTEIVELFSGNSDEEGWLRVSDIGTMLQKRYADFDTRNFGHKKMVPFLESMNLFEIRKVTDPANTKNPNGQDAFIKLKS
jgi:Uncharacterized conserved protein